VSWFLAPDNWHLFLVPENGQCVINLRLLKFVGILCASQALPNGISSNLAELANSNPNPATFKGSTLGKLAEPNLIQRLSRNVSYLSTTKTSK